MTPNIIHSTTLYFRQGSSDKIYQAAIEEVPGEDDAFLVNFAYGRRGSTLKTGTKTQKPVTREKPLTVSFAFRDPQSYSRTAFFQYKTVIATR